MDDVSATGTPWRQGRTVGRTVYCTTDDGRETLIGVMDTVGLAEMVVEAVNYLYGGAREAEQRYCHVCNSAPGEECMDESGAGPRPPHGER